MQEKIFCLRHSLCTRVFFIFTCTEVWLCTVWIYISMPLTSGPLCRMNSVAYATMYCWSGCVFFYFFQCTVCSVERGSGKEISFHLWEWAFNYLAGSALVGMAMACWHSGQTMRWKSSGPKTTKQRCRLVFPHRIQRPGISLQGCFWFLRISGAVAKPLSHGQEVFSVWDPLWKFSI